MHLPSVIGRASSYVHAPARARARPVLVLVAALLAPAVAAAFTFSDGTYGECTTSEGVARELVRAVQDARKQAGLEIADRIVLHVEGDEAVAAALAAHREYLMNETLASAWRRPGADAYVARQDEGDLRWVIHLARDAEAS